MTGYAYSVAREMYAEGELEKVVAFCMEHGVVYSEDDLFICAYPTHSSFIDKRKVKINLDIADTWYVYIATGSVKRAFEIIRPMKFISYERFDNNFRLIEFNRMRRLLWAV